MRYTPKLQLRQETYLLYSIFKSSLLTPFFLLGIFCSGTALFSQKKPSEYLKTYKSEVIVNLRSYSHTSINLEKGKLLTQRKHQKETLFLHNTPHQAALETLEYTPPFSSIENINAFCRIPKKDKDVYQTQKVSRIANKSIMSDEVFYEGFKAKQFEYPSLQKGAITYLEYTEIIHDPKLVGREVFTESNTTVDREFSLSYHKDITIDIQYYNCTVDDFDYEVHSSGSTITHRWVPKQIEKIPLNTNTQEFLNTLPHIAYRVVSYSFKGEEIPVLRDLNDLYHWYYQQNPTYITAERSALSRITDSLVYNEPSEMGKAEIIFNWVQSNIKYVKHENGFEGLSPISPEVVLSKRYGNSQDISTLLTAMLTHAKLHAFNTWIGTRNLPYTYSELPSPLSDNFMITSIYINSKYIFLDATTTCLTFPLPSPHIQGKQALIAIDSNNYIIQTVPTTASELSVNYDSAYFTINSKSLVGTGKRFYTGHLADSMKQVLNTKNQDQLNSLIKSHITKGSNKCQSDGYNLTQEPFKTSLKYNFEIPEYAYQTENRIFINMNLENVVSNLQLKDDKPNPLENSYNHKIIRDFTLQIPEGYIVGFVPKPLEIKHPNFGCIARYSLQDGTLRYQLEIDIRDLHVSYAERDNWNNMIKSLNSAYNTSITLIKS